jgi:hypothetical protein
MRFLGQKWLKTRSGHALYDLHRAVSLTTSLPNIMTLEPPTPTLRRFCRVQIDVAAPLIVGPLDGGERRIVSILGGSFAGEWQGIALRGEILPGGADWQLVLPDTTTQVQARFTMRTDDGALIDLQNQGIRHRPRAVIERLWRGEPVDPAEYSFRMTPRLTTGDARYAWLNKLVCVASGYRELNKVVYDIWEVL